MAGLCQTKNSIKFYANFLIHISPNITLNLRGGLGEKAKCESKKRVERKQKKRRRQVISQHIPHMSREQQRESVKERLRERAL